MLKQPVKRIGRWTLIPKQVRQAVHRTCCQIAACGAHYGYMKLIDGVPTMIREHQHHLLPRRWCEEHGINPHSTENLLSVCGQCHGRIKVFEDRLFQGDTFSFMEGMKKVGVPIDMILRFASQNGITELDGWRIGRT